MMNMYATSSDLAQQFGISPEQVLTTIENLDLPEILQQHVEVFDFGDSKIAQLTEIGFNAVALHLPLNAGGRDQLLIRWKEAFLSQHVEINPCENISEPTADEQQISVAPQVSSQNQPKYHTITEPEQFIDCLQAITMGINDFLALTQEKMGDAEFKQFSSEYPAMIILGKGYYRPSEFLQVLLDILRANYEPYALSTFDLNSNMDLLYAAIPEQAFNYGYFSLTSQDPCEFHEFWTEAVAAHAHNCGYSLDDDSALIVVVTAGMEKFNLDWLGEVHETLKSGCSVAEALGLIASSLNGMAPTARNTLVGFCWDEALADKVRISAWIVKQPNINTFTIN